MGLLGQCDGCKLRDDTIKDLREQLREANKMALAVIDAKAYALMHPPERVKADPNQKPAPLGGGPADFRRRRFVPEMSSEEIEATFQAQRDAAQEDAG